MGSFKLSYVPLGGLPQTVVTYENDDETMTGDPSIKN